MNVARLELGRGGAHFAVEINHVRHLLKIFYHKAPSH
jgi:hypothetical protein